MIQPSGLEDASNSSKAHRRHTHALVHGDVSPHQSEHHTNDKRRGKVGRTTGTLRLRYHSILKLKKIMT